MNPQPNTGPGLAGLRPTRRKKLWPPEIRPGVTGGVDWGFAGMNSQYAAPGSGPNAPSQTFGYGDGGYGDNGYGGT